MMKLYIFYIAFKDDVRRIPIDQLRAETVKVPDFEGDKELTRLFEMIFSDSFYDEFKTNPSLFKDSLPSSFPNHDYLVDFLTRLGDETQNNWRCRWAIEYALRDSLVISEWDKIVAYNECVMRVFSTFPDEFFEEYAGLSEDGQYELNDKL